MNEQENSTETQAASQPTADAAATGQPQQSSFQAENVSAAAAAPTPSGSASSAPAAAPARQPQEKPKGIVILLYVLLMVSAVVALLGFSSSLLPESARLVGPAAFAAFYAIFVIYRVVMIRRRRYPVTKAVFQIGLGAIFLMVLFSVRPQDAVNAPLKPASELLRHVDPSVRALACDALAAQGGESLQQASGELKKLLEDRHPEVRTHARKALDRAGAEVPAGTP